MRRQSSYRIYPILLVRDSDGGADALRQCLLPSLSRQSRSQMAMALAR